MSGITDISCFPDLREYISRTTQYDKKIDQQSATACLQLYSPIRVDKNGVTVCRHGWVSRYVLHEHGMGNCQRPANLKVIKHCGAPIKLVGKC